MEIAGRPFRFKKGFIDDLALFSVEETVKRLGKALLILHSPADTTVSIDHAGRIFMEAQYPKSFISLDQTDHLLLREEDARYAGALIAAWAERYF